MLSKFKPYQPTLADYAMRTKVGPMKKLALVHVCMRVLSTGENPCAVYKKHLARAMSTNKNNVRGHLDALRDLGLIDYIPGTFGILITVHEDMVTKSAMKGTQSGAEEE